MAPDVTQNGHQNGLANFLFYCALPTSLVAAIIFRYNFIGVIYLILLICWPFCAGIRRPYSKRFALVTLAFSSFFNLATIIFQIVVAASKEENLENEPNSDECSGVSQIKSFLGLVPLKDADVIHVVRLILPDIFVFGSSLATYLALRQIRAQRSHGGSQETQLIRDGPGGVTETFLASEHNDRDFEYFSLLNRGLFLASLCFLALAGIAWPSVLSLPYLLLFLLLTTLYSFHMDLEPLVPIYKLRLLISIYTAFHLVLLYGYQLQFLFDNQMLVPTHLVARLLGLKQLVKLDCNHPSVLSISSTQPTFNDAAGVNKTGQPCRLFEQNCEGTTWPAFVEPVFIMFLHFFCAFTFKVFNQMKQAELCHRSHLIGETDPMLNDYHGGGQRELHHSNVSTHSPISVAALHNRLSIFAAQFPLQKKQITTAMREKALYVFGLIMMMAWSVTYHSWITFFMLLWSCYLWMARNRDQVTLKHSKYITLYAIVLILLQFIYSLVLYETELPMIVDNNIDLKTLGLRNQRVHTHTHSPRGGLISMINYKTKNFFVKLNLTYLLLL